MALSTGHDEYNVQSQVSDTDSMYLSDRDLAKIHIAAAGRSAIEMADAIGSIDSVMEILEKRIQNRALYPTKKGSTVEVKKNNTRSVKAPKIKAATEAKAQQNFVCKECNYQTVRRGDYNKHILIHSGIKPYHCHLCNYKTTEKCRLNRHLESKLHTGEMRVPRKKKAECMVFNCDQCDFQTTDSADMLAHKANMHNDMEQHIQLVSTAHTDQQTGEIITFYTVSDSLTAGNEIEDDPT